MSATLSAGPGTLVLTVNNPTDIAGAQVLNGVTSNDTAIPRDDLIGMKVWYSTTSTFDPANNQGTLAYNGSGLTATIQGLTAGTTYYVKYALLSEIEPDNYTISNVLSAVPVTAEAYSAPTFYISNYGSTFGKDIDGTIYPSTGIIIETGYSNFKSSPQPTFQWKKDGVNITGATSFSYTVPASDYADGSTTHTYSCTVTGLDQAGVSKSVTSSTTIPLISSGARGPRTASGYLYYQTAAATAPGTPSASNYNFTTGQFGTLTSASGDTGTWGYSPISPSTTDTTKKAWVSRYVVLEPAYGQATGAATISTPTAGITFDGIVTFTNYASGTTPLATAASVNTKLSAQDLSASGTTVIDGGRIKTGVIDAAYLNLSEKLSVGGAASDVNTGTTQINGGKIQANSIDADRLTTSFLQVGTAANDINTNTTKISGGQIVTGSISADRLSIGQTTSNDRIRLYDNKIEVWASGVRRVVLGDLS